MSVSLTFIGKRNHALTALVFAIAMGTSITARADLITTFDGVTTGGWSLDNTGILSPTADAGGTGLSGIEANDQNDGGTYYVAPWSGDLSAENGASLRFGLVLANPGGSFASSAQDIILNGNGNQLTLDLAFDNVVPPIGTLLSFQVLLTADTFGTDNATFAGVMGNIDSIKIRAEYWTANGIESYLVTPAAVPVPAAIWLFGSGLLALFGFMRRR